MAEASTTFPVEGPITLQVRLQGAVSVVAREGLTEASVVLTPGTPPGTRSSGRSSSCPGPRSSSRGRATPAASPRGW